MAVGPKLWGLWEAGITKEAIEPRDRVTLTLS